MCSTKTSHLYLCFYWLNWPDWFQSRGLKVVVQVPEVRRGDVLALKSRGKLASISV